MCDTIPVGNDHQWFQPSARRGENSDPNGESIATQYCPARGDGHMIHESYGTHAKPSPWLSQG